MTSHAATDPTPDDRFGALAVELSRTRDLDDVLRQVARFTIEVLDYNDLVIYLVDLDGDGTLVQRAAWGPKSPEGIEIVDPLILRVGQGIVGSAAATGFTQLVPDTLDDPRHVMDTGSGRSEMAVPIVFRDSVIGVIDSEHPEPNFYTAEDSEAVNTIAALASGQIRAMLALESLGRSLDTQTALSANLARLAQEDQLTGCRNRHSFDLRLAKFAERGEGFTAAVIDLDGFKFINDVHGHDAGDDMLRLAAGALEELVGAEITTIARMGGDEFGVLSTMGVVQLRTLLDAFRQRIRDDALARGFSVTASIGVAHGADTETLHRADDATLIAKRLGGDQVVLHADAGDHIALLERERAWRAKVAEGLWHDEFDLVFQPIVSLENDDEVMAFEALLRAPGSGPGIEPTAELLAAATRYGRDSDIDRWVLDRLLDVLQLYPDLVVSQNWSPRSCDPQSPVLRHAVRELARRGIDPSRMIIEITEFAAIDDPQRFSVALAELRSHGLRVAIDQLGAGWTTLKLLSSIPVDIIKLDGESVRQLHTNPIARETIASSVRSAGLLDATVVAEWIETEADRAELQALGVHWGQGFLLGRPRPLREALLDHPTSIEPN